MKRPSSPPVAPPALNHRHAHALALSIAALCADDTTNLFQKDADPDIHDIEQATYLTEMLTELLHGLTDRMAR